MRTTAVKPTRPGARQRERSLPTFAFLPIIITWAVLPCCGCSCINCIGSAVGLRRQRGHTSGRN
jgi:hypothetical protein